MQGQSWALSVTFSMVKSDFFCIFYKVGNPFLHQSYLKSPLPVKLTYKKCKKSFIIREQIKKYLKCPALQATKGVSIECTLYACVIFIVDRHTLE